MTSTAAGIIDWERKEEGEREVGDKRKTGRGSEMNKFVTEGELSCTKYYHQGQLGIYYLLLLLLVLLLLTTCHHQGNQLEH